MSWKSNTSDLRSSGKLRSVWW